MDIRELTKRRDRKYDENIVSGSGIASASGDMATLLEVCDWHKEFGGLLAIASLSFSVKPGRKYVSGGLSCIHY